MASPNIHWRRFFSQWLPEVVLGPSFRFISRTVTCLFSCLLHSPAKRLTLNSGETSSALEPQPIEKKKFSSAILENSDSLLSYKSELEKIKCLVILPIHKTDFIRFHEGNSVMPLRKREIAGMEMSHFDGAAKRLELDNRSPMFNSGESSSALEPQPSKNRKLSSALVKDAHSALSYKSKLKKTNSPLSLPINETGFKRFCEGNSSTPLRKSVIAGMEMSHFDGVAISRAKLGSSMRSLERVYSCPNNGGNPPIGKTPKHFSKGEIPTMSKIKLYNRSPKFNSGVSSSALEPQPSKKCKLSSALVEDAHSALSCKSELKKTNSPLSLPIDETGFKRFCEGISSTPLRKSGIAGMEMSHFDGVAISRAKLGSSMRSLERVYSCPNNGGNPPIGKTPKHSSEGEIPTMSKIMKNAPFPTAASNYEEIGITDDDHSEARDDVPITDLEAAFALEKGMNNSSASSKVTENVLITTTDAPTSTGKSRFCISAPDYSSGDTEEEEYENVLITTTDAPTSTGKSRFCISAPDYSSGDAEEEEDENVLITTTDAPTSTGKSLFCILAPDYSSDDVEEEEDDQSFSFWPQDNFPAPEIADSYGCTPYWKPFFTG